MDFILGLALGLVVGAFATYLFKNKLDKKISDI